MGLVKKVWTFSLEGERGRAVVRFWKGTLMALVSLVLVPLSGGVPISQIVEAWPQIIATALLTGLGLGTEKMLREIKK